MNNESIKAIKNAYNMLVTFRKIVENYPQIKTYSNEEIQRCYRELWLQTLPNENKPWRD